MTVERTAHVSRPTLSIEGQERPALAASTVSVEITETIAGLYACEITVNNHGATADGTFDFLFFDADYVDFGKRVEVQLGNPPAPVFDGYITGLEADYIKGGGATLTMLAEERLQDLRMTRRTRTFEDMTDAAIIRQIADDHRLTPQIELNGPSHRVVAQVNLSDLAFIRERARAFGGELWLAGDTLHVATRDDRRQGTPLALSYGAELKAFTVIADVSHQTTAIHVTGWDVENKTAIDEAAQESAISSELAGGQSGGSFLSASLGTRVETLVHTVPLTSDEASKMAEARYRERARRFVTGLGHAAGDTRLRVGRSVTLSGLGRFDGDYYVTRSKHTFTLDEGYQTGFEVERAGL